jgi:ribosome-associated translation inhibitor RaiA
MDGAPATPGELDTRPVPDPTVLTTQLVNTAIAAFREVVETRLNGLDNATKIAGEKVDHIPDLADQQRREMRADIERSAASLRELLEEKISALGEVVQEKFDGIDKRLAEAKVALDAALAAAKEAVTQQNEGFVNATAKSELATQKQIDAIQAGTATALKALDDKIADLKGRQDRGDTGGRGEGLQAQQVAGRANVGMALVVASIAIGFGGLIIAVVSIITR